MPVAVVSRSLTTEFKEAMVKQMDSLTQGDSYDTPSALSNPDPDAPPVRSRPSAVGLAPRVRAGNS